MLIKIFAFPSHQTAERTSGVDFARIIQPMKHLDGFKHNGNEFQVRHFDIVKDLYADWRNIVKDVDIVYFNYTVNPWAFAHLGFAVREAGKKIIMDLDDAVWNVMSDNPTYMTYKKDAQGIKDLTSICNEVDGMTTTSLYLKNVIVHNTRKRHEQIKVFPNYVDLKLYSHRSPPKNTPYEINLTHFGSTTHFYDLTDNEFEAGVDRIMKEYPNVIITTIGHSIAKHANKWGSRYRTDYGHTDIYRWIGEKFPTFMDQSDICVVPLVDSVYNRCKSSIKFLEMSSAMKPGVWQDIRQYREVVQDGKNGFLASSADQWYNAIKTLITDVQKRREVAENAFKTVSDGWTIQGHLEDYAEYFEGLLTGSRPVS